ncbi:hypothetical protein BCE75_10898 [Isoptericola sp. CG 20/1183]|uniref:Lipoprotein n=1 Tax=Isoptericola halotolerans TaxID=300560 RepID=A0ABX5EEV0_9MICO|nr:MULTISPECIES: hypothetical protein [Isoptericola]PRZ05120.1 hypothetical protein BCL65_10899 [Isoptericola halotolerans]PRZ05858.1 hypothetical protein BCE75_10898 [Isoptericola sp. CG 20/1183]
MRTAAVTGLGVVVALGLAACVGDPAGGPPPAVVPTPSATQVHGRWPDSDDTAQPPPFEVRTGHDALLLYPFTYCYRQGCADGVDDDPPSVGNPPEMFVHVPVAEFDELTVSLTPDADDAARPVPANVAELGDGWWRVTLRGLAGDHRLTLFAVGDGAGDMVADVRWGTTDDGPTGTATP